MRAVSHRVVGLDVLRRRLLSLPEAAGAAVAPALLAAAEGVAADVRTALGDTTDASEPGATPHDPARRLADTVKAEPGPAGCAVVVSAPFAHFLEYGTTRMAARPFLRPAGLRAGRGARALLAAALRREFGR